MSLVFGQDRIVCDYVTAGLGLARRWHGCIGIGVDVGGAIRAGIVIEPITDFDAAMTVFSETPRAASPEMFRRIFGLVFGELGYKRVTFEVHPKNKRSRKLAEGVGARLEGKKRRGLDGRRNALIYGLLPEECRYYEIAQTA